VVWYNNICRTSLYPLTVKNAAGVTVPNPVRDRCGIAVGAPLPFPYKGVAPIVLSWFFTPVLTAIGAAILFGLARSAVLRRKNSYFLSFVALPFFVALTTWLCIYFIFTKGAKSLLTKEVQGWTENQAMWIAACVAAGAALFTILVLNPLIHYGMKRNFLIA
jgi:solute carrier family 20 (sodium-dependent phosphate transporter)